MVLGRILRDVRFERDAGAFEEDDLPRPVVVGGVTVVRVVERAEVRRDADGVAPVRDVFEDPRIPDAFLALPIGSVVIEVSELPDERALADAWSADDRDAHRVNV